MAHARPVTRVDRDGFRVFSYNFRVESGYFLSSGEIFDPRLTHRTVGSGQVFSGGSGRVYRVGQAMIKYTYPLDYPYPLGIILRLRLAMPG
jgi:hypothetical protein